MICYAPLGCKVCFSFDNKLLSQHRETHYDCATTITPVSKSLRIIFTIIKREMEWVLAAPKGNMVQLRLTKKMQDAAGVKKSDLCEVGGSDHILGNWYVNMFYYFHRKHLVFMNELTLFSFPVFAVKKSDVVRLPELFYEEVEKALVRDSLPKSAINKVMNGINPIELTKTHSASILGNLNDLIQRNKWYMERYGSFDDCDIKHMQKLNNYMPQENIGWKFSGELLRELIDSVA